MNIYILSDKPVQHTSGRWSLWINVAEDGKERAYGQAWAMSRAEAIERGKAIITALQRADTHNLNTLSELSARIEACRHYLMGVDPKNITVEDALEALGFTREGL